MICRSWHGPSEHQCSSSNGGGAGSQKKLFT